MTKKESTQLSILGLVGIYIVCLLQGGNARLPPGFVALSDAVGIPYARAAQVGTLPALFSVLGGLLAGRTAGRVLKYKTFLIISLLISAVGGSIPALFPAWRVILFSRACVGFGVGVYFAIPPALIMKFYQGDGQRNKLGLANAFGSAGGLIMMWTVGPLVDLQWNFMFWIYLIGVLPLILILTCLPEPPAPAETSVIKQKVKLPAPVILNCVIIFLASILGMEALLFISNVITDRGFGTGVHVSTVAIMFNIAAALLSFCFGPLYKIFKKYLAVVILVVITIGLCLVYYANSLIMAGAGMFCVGAFLLLIPTLLTDNAKYLEPASITFAASFLTVAMNLGNFVMQYYAEAVTAIAGTVLSPLFFGIFGLGAATILFFFIRLFQKEPAQAKG
jgi:predicted MFS family arabinose efflux permease